MTTGRRQRRTSRTSRNWTPSETERCAMNEVAFAATTVFAFGFLSGLAVAAAVRRIVRAQRPPNPVALRLRAVRRSRVALVEQRLDALERATTSVAGSPER